MKSKIKIAILFSAVVAVFSTSCNDDLPGKYKITDGTPTIYYIRPANAASQDVLLTGALLGESICIVGDNLTSIQELYFNDKRAILNINLITKNTLFVNVPRERADVITDKIYFINQAGEKTDYDFIVRMPAPVISSIKCEYVPEGQDVVLYGDYFFDDDPVNAPISVKVGTYSVPPQDIVDVKKTQLTFKAPPVEITGKISVTSIHGAGAKSKQIFRDTRGIIVDFDSPFVAGWGVIGAVESAPEYSISGKYMRFEGAISESNAGAWGQMDAMSFHYWGEDNGIPEGNLFSSDPATSIFKFEANVVNPWSALAMQIFFFHQGDTNGAMWEYAKNPSGADYTNYPRGLWRPWLSGANVVPYTSGGWVTVSIPIKDFNLNSQGGKAAIDMPSTFGALTMIVFRGGVLGLPCNPKILIDNIRVVPAE